MGTVRSVWILLWGGLLGGCREAAATENVSVTAEPPRAAREREASAVLASARAQSAPLPVLRAAQSAYGSQGPVAPGGVDASYRTLTAVDFEAPPGAALPLEFEAESLELLEGGAVQSSVRQWLAVLPRPFEGARPPAAQPDLQTLFPSGAASRRFRLETPRARVWFHGWLTHRPRGAALRYRLRLRALPDGRPLLFEGPVDRGEWPTG